jgi:hypothetical protein
MGFSLLISAYQVWFATEKIVAPDRSFSTTISNGFLPPYKPVNAAIHAF